MNLLEGRELLGDVGPDGQCGDHVTRDHVINTGEGQ